MSMFKILAITAGVAGLAGCAYQDSTTEYPGFGDAVRQNNAVMIIDPNPAGAQVTDIDMDGARAGLAIDRYRAGKVIPPKTLSTTTDLSTQGSGGSTGQ
jgi:type IV pilus biogenesis protein CpaD/CtpE